MRWIVALTATALLIGVVGVMTRPSDDAASHDWLDPLIEDGRASLLAHLDLIEPGTPLAFTGARCRSDGTVVLFYANRFLWVIENAYYAQTSPPYRGPDGFSGGLVDGASPPGSELSDEVWLAEHVEVSCEEPIIGEGACRSSAEWLTPPMHRRRVRAPMFHTWFYG
jgi:hypothetical protein